MSIAELLVIALVVFLVQTPAQTRALAQQMGRWLARFHRYYDNFKAECARRFHE